MTAPLSTTRSLKDSDIVSDSMVCTSPPPSLLERQRYTSNSSDSGVMTINYGDIRFELPTAAFASLSSNPLLPNVDGVTARPTSPIYFSLKRKRDDSGEGYLGVNSTTTQPPLQKRRIEVFRSQLTRLFIPQNLFLRVVGDTTPETPSHEFKSACTSRMHTPYPVNHLAVSSSDQFTLVNNNGDSTTDMEL